HALARRVKARADQPRTHAPPGVVILRLVCGRDPGHSREPVVPTAFGGADHGIHRRQRAVEPQARRDIQQQAAVGLGLATEDDLLMTVLRGGDMILRDVRVGGVSDVSVLAAMRWVAFELAATTVGVALRGVAAKANAAWRGWQLQV